MKKNNLKVWISIIVSLVLLAWMASMTDWNKTFSQLKGYNWYLLIPAFFAFWIHFILRAMRWRWLLPLEQPSDHDIRFDSIMVGNLASFLLPLRIGEFVRPFLFSKSSLTSFAGAFVSVVLERFFDLSTVLLGFGALVYLSPVELDPKLIAAGYALTTIAGAIAFFIFFATVAPDLITKIYDFFIKPVPKFIASKLNKIFKDFLNGAIVLRSGSALPKVVIFTILVWLTTILRFYVFLLGFSSIESYFVLSCVLTVTVSLAVAMPSAPGFIGTYEIGCIAAFLLLGIDTNQAVAFAVLSHTFEYALICLFGFIGLARRGVKFNEIKDMPITSG